MGDGSDREMLSDSDFEEGDFLRSNRKRRSAETEKQGRDWIDQAGEHIIPSSKTIAAKAQIVSRKFCNISPKADNALQINWLEEDETVKIIVYTVSADSNQCSLWN